MSKTPEPPPRKFHIEAARAERPDLTEFDMDSMGSKSVRIHIPTLSTEQTRNAVKLLARACEVALFQIDQRAKLGERGTLMLVRQVFRSATATINRNKRGEQNL